jgi:hypothetical protein
MFWIASVAASGICLLAAAAALAGSPSTIDFLANGTGSMERSRSPVV